MTPLSAVQISSLVPSNYDILDFHAHLNESIPVFLDNIWFNAGIRAGCIMPSWINIDTINFANIKKNNFLTPQPFFERVRALSSQFSHWNGSIFVFLPFFI